MKIFKTNYTKSEKIALAVFGGLEIFSLGGLAYLKIAEKIEEYGLTRYERGFKAGVITAHMEDGFEDGFEFEKLKEENRKLKQKLENIKRELDTGDEGA